MRGTRSIGRTVGRGFGIIPAYAGNTRLPVIVDFVGGDHPRVCGEHLTAEARYGC